MARDEDTRDPRGGSRARAIGLNHVALEVGDLDEALAFYGGLFQLTLRGRAPGMAFVDLGDQFIALSEGRSQPPDEHRHVGLVVDDREVVRRALEDSRADILPSSGLDFRDPWGNRIQVVQYRDVQFSKAPAILKGMGLAELEKSPKALEELARKGLGPD